MVLADRAENHQPESDDDAAGTAEDVTAELSRIQASEGGESATGEKSSAEAEHFKSYTAYTVKLPSDQLAALQSIWLDLKKLYGAHSPDKSGMIEAAVGAWLRRWESSDREALLEELLEIRKNTRKRQYKKGR